MEFNCLAFELDSANLEVNANCRDVAFCIGIVCETEEETGLERVGELIVSERTSYLSDAGVTDEKEFKEVVVLAGVHVEDRGREKQRVGSKRLSGE